MISVGQVLIVIVDRNDNTTPVKKIDNGVRNKWNRAWIGKTLPKRQSKWTDTYSAIQTVRYALKSTQKSSVDYFKRDYIMYGPAFYFEYFRKLHSFAHQGPKLLKHNKSIFKGQKGWPVWAKIHLGASRPLELPGAQTPGPPALTAVSPSSQKFRSFFTSQAHV